MLTKIPMPSGGTNTDQLLVISWKKQVGDPVKRGDILLEVETDKAVLEVESFAAGVLLKRAVEEGEYCTAGEVIAYVGKPEDDAELDRPVAKIEPEASEIDDFAPIVTPKSTKPAPSTPAGRATPAPLSAGGVKATPAAKKAARDLGLDLQDVRKRAGKEVLHRDDVSQVARQQGPAADSSDSMAYELRPLTTMRRIIAERMQLGASVPAFTAEIEVDMSGAMQLRSDLNAHLRDVRVGYHDILAKCVAIAAADYPLVNASFTEDGIRIYARVNIGLAVSLDQGLAVPVVTNVREKDIAAIARENTANIAQVRSVKFDPKVLENGTFTISNLGVYPISRFTAILNPPQSAILAVGAIQSRPVWVEGRWAERPTVSLTGTFDHRVVDGAYGAQFLTRLKELLEHPHLIFIS